MIVSERKGDVEVVRFDAPPHNALDAKMADAIEAALDRAILSKAHVLHLRSESTSFCGGAHPERLAAWVAEGPDALAADAARFNELFLRLETAPLIVLAEIGGAALGAGLGLALACDLRCAADDARFGVPEAKVGTLPAGGTIARLTRVAGSRAARRLLLTAELMAGDTALAFGLVDWIMQKAELPAFASAMAQRIAALSPLALARAKSLIAATSDAELGQEENALRELAASAPDRKLLSAFVDKLLARSDAPRQAVERGMANTR
jgi:enoyl-CoA hydratase/carnithine racemase